jgi:hypothetical protein
MMMGLSELDKHDTEINSEENESDATLLIILMVSVIPIVLLFGLAIFFPVSLLFVLLKLFIKKTYYLLL